MNYYELVLIIDPNLDDTAVEETVNKFKDIVIKQEGEIFKIDNWGRRKLAYILNKHEKGNYVFLYFKAPADTIAQVEKLCKVTDAIIKFMAVRLVKKKQIEAILPKPVEAAESAPAPEETPSPAEGEAVAAAEGAPAEEQKDV